MVTQRGFVNTFFKSSSPSKMEFRQSADSRLAESRKTGSAFCVSGIVKSASLMLPQCRLFEMERLNKSPIVRKERWSMPRDCCASLGCANAAKPQT